MKRIKIPLESAVDHGTIPVTNARIIHQIVRGEKCNAVEKPEDRKEQAQAAGKFGITQLLQTWR